MLNEPLVSIIIPTHNRPELVMRGIKAALAQTYQNIEVIVVDDVGNAPVNDMKELSPKVIYKRIPETYWMSDNRNEGIRIARGKYILLVDDDDYILPNCLSTLIPVMENDSSIGVCCANGYFSYAIDETPTIIHAPNNMKELKGDLFTQILWWTDDKYAATWVMRKDIFDKVGVYRQARGEDLDLVLRMALITNIYYSPELLGVNYKRRDMSNDSQKLQSSLQGKVIVIETLLKCLDGLKDLAARNNKVLTLKERLHIYLQKYYYRCYILSCYYMFNNSDKTNRLIKTICDYPLFSPLTILTPLSQNKNIREVALKLKSYLSYL